MRKTVMRIMAVGKKTRMKSEPVRGTTADANGGLRGGLLRRVSPRGFGGSATNKLGGARTFPCLQETNTAIMMVSLTTDFR